MMCTPKYDEITLRYAMENMAWMAAYLTQPDRNIRVIMTFEDLYQIKRLLEERFCHKIDENGVTYMENKPKKGKKKA